MSDFAALITSIAGLISAAGGVFIGYLALTRGSPRERERAARYALDRLVGKDESEDDGGTDDAQWEAIDELRRKLGGEP